MNISLCATLAVVVVIGFQQASFALGLENAPAGHVIEPFAHRELRELVPDGAVDPAPALRSIYAVDSWNVTRIAARGPSKLTVVTYLDVPQGTKDAQSQYEIIMSEVVPHSQASPVRLFVEGKFLPEEDVYREVARRSFTSKPLAGIRYRAKSNVGKFMMPTEPRSFGFDVPEGVHVYAFSLGKMDPEVTVWAQAFWANVEVYSDTHVTPPVPKEMIARSRSKPLPAGCTVAVDFPDAPLRVGGLYKTVISTKMPDGSSRTDIRWVEPKAPGLVALDVEVWDKGSCAGERRFEFPVKPQVRMKPYFVIAMYEQTDGTVMNVVNDGKYHVNSAFSARRRHRPPGSNPKLARESYERVFSEIADIGANTVIPFLEVVPDHYPQYMEVAARHGLKAIPSAEDLMHFLLGSRTRGAHPTNEQIYDEVRTTVERLKHYPNLLAYAVGDEPDMEGIAVVDRVVKIYAALDPDHPLYIPYIANSGAEGSLTETVRRLAPYKPPFVAVDWYPAMKEHKPGEFVESCAANMLGSGRTYAKMGVSWWFISQAFGDHIIWRWLSPEEYRFHIHAALACGAKGVLQCLYSTSGPEDNQFEYYIEGPVAADGTKRPQWYEIQRLNRYMASIADVLLSLRLSEDEFAECANPKAMVVSHTDHSGGRYVSMWSTRTWSGGRSSGSG